MSDGFKQQGVVQPRPSDMIRVVQNGVDKLLLIQGLIDTITSMVERQQDIDRSRTSHRKHAYGTGPDRARTERTGKRFYRLRDRIRTLAVCV